MVIGCDASLFQFATSAGVRQWATDLALQFAWSARTPTPAGAQMLCKGLAPFDLATTPSAPGDPTSSILIPWEPSVSVEPVSALPPCLGAANSCSLKEVTRFSIETLLCQPVLK